MLDGLVLALLDWLCPQKAKIEPRGEDRIIQVEGELMRLVGKVGVTKTALRPAGKVMIEGQHYEACVDAGFVGEGERVEIVGVRQITLVVRPTA